MVQHVHTLPRLGRPQQRPHSPSAAARPSCDPSPHPHLRCQLLIKLHLLLAFGLHAGLQLRQLRGREHAGTDKSTEDQWHLRCREHAGTDKSTEGQWHLPRQGTCRDRQKHRGSMASAEAVQCLPACGSLRSCQNHTSSLPCCELGHVLPAQLRTRTYAPCPAAN